MHNTRRLFFVMLVLGASLSFCITYLLLQSKMQHENRRFTLISNIMKTRHDTAKNSISNVR